MYANSSCRYALHFNMGCSHGGREVWSFFFFRKIKLVSGEKIKLAQDSADPLDYDLIWYIAFGAWNPRLQDKLLALANCGTQQARRLSPLGFREGASSLGFATSQIHFWESAFSLQCQPLLISAITWEHVIVSSVNLRRWLTVHVSIFLQNSSKAAQAPSPWGAGGK